MARLTNGGIVGKNVTTPTQVSANGKWNLSDQYIYKQQNIWTSNIITSGLNLWLDAGASISYPGSGTVWYDISGNSNNGTLNNGVGYSSNNGGYLVFDGSNDFVSVPNSSLYKNNNGTIEWWNYFKSYQNADITTFGVGSGSYGQFYFRTYSNTFTFAILPINSSQYFIKDLNSSELSSNFPLNTWRHIAVTYNTSTSTAFLYINGVQSFSIPMSSTPVASSWTPASLHIGGYSWDGYSNTNIAQYRIYNRDLSAQEVLNNFNADRSRYGI